MKTNGKYRFTLQFQAETEEQIRAGEFLERLGNRKSAIIVEALNEYLTAHPNLLTPQAQIQVKLSAGYRRTEIEELIRLILEERLSGQDCVKFNHTVASNPQSNGVEASVAQMLDNLDAFL